MSFTTEIKRIRDAAMEFARSNKTTSNLTLLTDSEFTRFEALWKKSQGETLTGSESAEWERLTAIVDGTTHDPARDTYASFAIVKAQREREWVTRVINGEARQVRGGLSLEQKTAYQALEAAIDSGDPARIAAATAHGIEVLKEQQG